MSSKEDMKQLVFQDMFAPQDFEQGPPFPKTVQYGTIPPVVKTFVKNRRTPMYFLGWRFSERDFLQKYGKPNAPLENILNVYDALLFPEWGRKFTDAWKKAPPRIHPYGNFTSLSKEDREWGFLLPIATNVNAAEIELSKNKDYIEFAREVMDMSDYPTWYLY